MKIVVGTISENKLHFLEMVLNELGVLGTEIHGVSVASNVGEQPVSIEETTDGAKNRAINALKENPSDISVGLEGGLIKLEDGYSYVCVSAVLFGGKFFIGESHALKLPQSVSEAISNGEESADALRAHVPNTKQEAELVSKILSRKCMFKKAIKDAFLLLNKEF